MRYFFHMSFMGSRYNGWQRQKNAPSSVQQYVEAAISRVTGLPVTVMGCGRTDAGVHALQFYVHADFLDVSLPDIQKINYALPSDIAIHSIIPVHDRAHSRYDAIERKYEYFMHFEKDALLSDLTAYYPRVTVNHNLASEACRAIVKSTDFRNFCTTPDRHNTTICVVNSCEFKLHKDGSRAVFSISANRFLKSMVRILVWEVLEVSMQRSTLDEFVEKLNGKVKYPVRKKAHPQGLYLSEVIYPYLRLPVKSELLEMMKL
ncbi:MAG: tRNA pseudouridine synthase A [Saprospiraceae bacterium]|nr:tRNA pseudouridine synthase A [Saprospiraceae bacterium]